MILIYQFLYINLFKTSILFNLSGESGIRTRDTLLAYTRFPGVPLQPLEHLSLKSLFQKRVQITKNILFTSHPEGKNTEFIDYILYSSGYIL